jgi:hypothetical protein
MGKFREFYKVSGLGGNNSAEPEIRKTEGMHVKVTVENRQQKRFLTRVVGLDSFG